MTKDEIGRLNSLIRAGMAQHRALAVISGKAEETTAWAEQSVSNRANELFVQPAEDWPQTDLIWDLAPGNWHRAEDGMTPSAFGTAYPGLRLYEVGRAELEVALARAAQRVHDPFSEAYRSKTSRLVAHLEAGGKVTPPLVVHTSAGFALAGGNHRFGWACHLGLTSLPILGRASEQKRLTTLAPSLREVPKGTLSWQSAPLS